MLTARLANTLAAAKSIAFVWPLPGEPDLRPLMHALNAAGRDISLPAILGPGQPLEFRRWDAVPLEEGPCGTRHPRSHTDNVVIRPDIILVPLIAFDRQRNRLGRGGGFYDRTLAVRDQPRAVGFAYATAEIDAVPTEPHDRKLDAIVTDRESF